MNDVVLEYGLWTKIIFQVWQFMYSSVPNKSAANLINFLENSNLHALIKDLHFY